MTCKDKFLAILSGLSGDGKGSLQAAIAALNTPNPLASRPVLLTSRRPRASEKHGLHYYFEPMALLHRFQDDPNFVVCQVRSDMQALDMIQVESLLSESDLVFAEVYHTFGQTLRACADNRSIPFVSIFLSSVPPDASDQEVVDAVTANLTLRGTESEAKIAERAAYAPTELRSAIDYTHRIVSPCTEDNVDEWGQFGTRNGKVGERCIRTLDDLGKNARCLVVLMLDILAGNVPTLEKHEYLLIEAGDVKTVTMSKP